MKVNFRFVGSFRNATKKSRVVLELSEGAQLKEAIKRIVKEFPKIKSALIDPELDDPRPNTLIIVNGREISVLKGLQTVLNDGDEVVFIPVSHGG
ncbi:MoaD/ThiS family protein [Candidatus Bathyarchaeota archaeon]|nr:MoaD/ThiS family protein [Candidatus Bathyarchaeota archaeon]MBS7636971.1 MoaD/ThiS family protein [Candidatus Bathyarchaeota archaeon]